MPVALAQPAVYELCPGLRLPVRVGSSVERVAQHGNDVAVRWGPPFQLLMTRTTGWPRKRDSVLAHVQKDLSGTPKALEEPEHGVNRILDPKIGVELESSVLLPDETDRHRYSQFAASCLCLSGLHKTLAHRRELELAHRALETQNEPIVWDSGVVNAFAINDSGTNHPAQFE